MRNNSIGSQITAERNKLQMNKREFAEAIDMNAAQLSDVEHGVALLSLQRLIQISKFTNAPVDVFFKDFDKMFLIYSIDDYCGRINKKEATELIDSLRYLLGK